MVCFSFQIFVAARGRGADETVRRPTICAACNLPICKLAILTRSLRSGFGRQHIERESGNSMSSAKEREILERQRRIASSFGGTSSSRGTGAAASSSTNWRRQDTRSTCSTNSIVCTRASLSFLDASSTAESSSMVPMFRIHSTVCLSADL